MKKHIILLILILGLVTLFAKNSDAQARFFMPTEVGTSAEMIARGNIEGFSNTAEVLLENPASLHTIKHFSVSAFTTTFMDEVTYQAVSIALKTKKGVIGAAYMSAGVDDITKTYQDQDEITNPLGIIVPVGTFKYSTEVAKLSYQFSQTKRLHWGISGDYYITTIDTVKGTGYNLDAGVKYDGKKLDMSLAIKNFLPGYDVSYSGGESEGKEEVLPAEIVFASRYTLGPINLFGQIKSGGRYDLVTKSGGISYKPGFFPWIEFTAGYKEFGVLDTIETNTTVGVGLTLENVKFNYALESSEHIEFDKKHYFSVGIKF
jgi:hypothetical protein